MVEKDMAVLPLRPHDCQTLVVRPTVGGLVHIQFVVVFIFASDNIYGVYLYPSIRWAKAEEERLQQEEEARAREAEEAVKIAIGERERAREVVEQDRMARHDEDVGEGGGIVGLLLCCCCRCRHCCFRWWRPLGI